MNNALSMTVIFEANSLNYGEGIANISELKKIHRGTGVVHTFVSRQSIRYDIIRLGNELFGWNLDTVDKASGVVQFKKDVTIKDSTEMDLFGYLKTAKSSKKRAAVVRLSHAISLEPYRSDWDFLNNLGLAERINESANLANIEQHQSLYTYTVTIDLMNIGKDINDNVELSNEEKSKRVHEFLDILKILNRNIRGRQENLSPLFVIGGVYPVANPFFLGKIKLGEKNKGWAVNTSTLLAVMNQTFAGEKIGDCTNIGILDNMFENQAELETELKDKLVSIEDFFNKISQDVQKVYEVV